MEKGEKERIKTVVKRRHTKEWFSMPMVIDDRYKMNVHPVADRITGQGKQVTVDQKKRSWSIHHFYFHDPPTYLDLFRLDKFEYVRSL